MKGAHTETPNQSDFTKTARERFADLLPPSYGEPTVKNGSVETDINNPRVKEGPPRYRGGSRLANLLLHPLRGGWEQYQIERRYMAVGTAEVCGWAGSGETTRLAIRESRFTPIKPAYGDTTPITHLSAEYVLKGYTDDLGRVSRTGIAFGFLQTGNNGLLRAEVTPFIPLEGSGIEEGNAFLQEHGFVADVNKLGPRIVDLADLCIRLAQESTS